MPFDFYQRLIDDDGEIDQEAADRYCEALIDHFIESPEGVTLKERGVEPGNCLRTFFRYARDYVGVTPSTLATPSLRSTLSVYAEKVTGRPEDLDLLIPELEAYCDFVQRAFGVAKAAAWKREVQRLAPSFRRALRNPHHWGMAKSILMEGLAQGIDLNSAEAINQWMKTLQAEQLAKLLAPSVEEDAASLLSIAPEFGSDAVDVGEEPREWGRGISIVDDANLYELGALASSSHTKREKAKQKSRKKQSKASHRRNDR